MVQLYSRACCHPSLIKSLNSIIKILCITYVLLVFAFIGIIDLIINSIYIDVGIVIVKLSFSSLQAAHFLLVQPTPSYLSDASQRFFSQNRSEACIIEVLHQHIHPAGGRTIKVSCWCLSIKKARDQQRIVIRVIKKTWRCQFISW